MLDELGISTEEELCSTEELDCISELLLDSMLDELRISLEELNDISELLLDFMLDELRASILDELGATFSSKLLPEEQENTNTKATEITNAKIILGIDDNLQNQFSTILEFNHKLNFYLSAVDDILKHETDNPTIGIMLCKTKDRLTAEYALKDINKPIGVSEYKLSDFVPEELIDILPSAEDIEKRVKLKFDVEEGV